ncbi:MAG: hypothetical protein F6K48_35715, partial [Okeania sp. SIO3H1]|nr:hypothetical protein [Okeania sp. SIO3H1]
MSVSRSTLRTWRIYGRIATYCLIVIAGVGGYALAHLDAIVLEIGLVSFFALLLVVWYLAERHTQDAVISYEYRESWAAENEFNSLYERSPIAYLSVGTNGSIKRANPAAVHLLGETLDTVTSRNWLQYID